MKETNDKNLERFLQIHDEMEQTIMDVVMRYTNDNYHISQEITQEVFMKLYENMDMMYEEHLLFWMLVVAKNLAKNYIKKSKVIIPNAEMEAVMDPREHAPGADEETFKNIEFRKQERMWAKLFEVNPRWYEVMTMVYLLDMQRSEAAEKLGISIGALNNVLLRARKWLKANKTTDEDDFEQY